MQVTAITLFRICNDCLSPNAGVVHIPMRAVAPTILRPAIKRVARLALATYASSVRAYDIDTSERTIDILLTVNTP